MDDRGPTGPTDEPVAGPVADVELPRPRSDLRAAVCEGHLLLLDRRRQVAHVLDPVTGLVWEELGRPDSPQPRPFDDLVRALATDCGLAEDAMADTVRRAVSELETLGLIELDAPGDDPVPGTDDADATRPIDSPSTSPAVTGAEQVPVATIEETGFTVTVHAPSSSAPDPSAPSSSAPSSSAPSSSARDSSMPDLGADLRLVLGSFRTDRQADCDGAGAGADPQVHSTPYRLDVVDTGATTGSRYVIGLDGTTVASAPDPASAIGEVLRTLNRLAVAHTSGLALHAGAVTIGGSAVIVTGTSGSGKTTLVTALVGSGGGYLTDEVVDVTIGNRADGFRKPIEIEDRAFSLGIDAPPIGTNVRAGFEKRWIDPRRIGPLGTPGPVGAIVILSGRSDDAAMSPVTALPPLDAVRAVLPNVFAHTFDAPDALQRLADLCSSVPVFALDRRPVAEMVATVRALVANPSA